MGGGRGCGGSDLADLLGAQRNDHAGVVAGVVAADPDPDPGGRVANGGAGLPAVPTSSQAVGGQVRTRTRASMPSSTRSSPKTNSASGSSGSSKAPDAMAA
jgi:hypothetical protein